MFIVEIGSVITTGDLRTKLLVEGHDRRSSAFVGVITFWLWLTVLFANFAEADRRGARQGAGGRAARDAHDDDRAAADRRRPGWRRWRRRSCRKGDQRRRRGGVIIPAAARSSRASAPWTSRRSPASPLR